MNGVDWVWWARTAAVILFAGCQLALALYGLHRYVLVAHRWRARAGVPVPSAAVLPRVTVQLPVYNEPRVVERLIDAACQIEYPRELLDIQVLDDSTDGTTDLARARAALHRSRGVSIEVLHRRERSGFKAGALREGMQVARGEFLAIFDADFLPTRDFLHRLLPAFEDPSVGMVQARWGHVNQPYSMLTELQSLFLDGHFLIEQGARFDRNRFFNFNGTAGVWRRTCIEGAGGWSAETLTEDLDLSYRAQLAGWRFRYCEDVVVPAELPVDVLAFKSQQRRWAKGSLQTARKVLPVLWRRSLPFASKVEAVFHLTSNLSYPTFLASALLLPVVFKPGGDPLSLFLGVMMLLGTIGVLLFFAETERRAGRTGWRSAGRVFGALAFGMGMSLAQTRAVLSGLLRRGGAWERTPKHGVTGHGHGWRPAASEFGRRGGFGELTLAAYFAAVALWFLWRAEWVPLPFLILLVSGLSYVGWLSATRPGARAVAPSA